MIEQTLSPISLIGNGEPTDLLASLLDRYISRAIESAVGTRKLHGLHLGLPAASIALSNPFGRSGAIERLSSFAPLRLSLVDCPTPHKIMPGGRAQARASFAAIADRARARLFRQEAPRLPGGAIE
jgi:hypothetical protein